MTGRLPRWLGAIVALVYLFLHLPLLVLMVFSFNASRQTAVWEGFTTKWYVALAHNARILSSVQNSLIVAALTTVVSTVIGTLVGIDAVVRKKRSVAGGQFTFVSKFALRSRERRHQFDFHLH